MSLLQFLTMHAVLLSVAVPLGFMLLTTERCSRQERSKVLLSLTSQQDHDPYLLSAADGLVVRGNH